MIAVHIWLFLDVLKLFLLIALNHLSDRVSCLGKENTRTCGPLFSSFPLHLAQNTCYALYVDTVVHSNVDILSANTVEPTTKCLKRMLRVGC